MTPDEPQRQGERLTDAEIAPLVAAFIAGDAAATERLAALLSNHARLTADEFLKPDHPDADDLAQDAVIASLDYVRRQGGFSGSIVHFTIAVTRNRCRNWLLWRRRHAASPLDGRAARATSREPDPLRRLEADEIRRLVQQAVDRLDDLCRRLLRALYIEDVTIEEVRRRSGLKSVQSIYYRRARCLEKAGAILKERLEDCSCAGKEANEQRPRRQERNPS